MISSVKVVFKEAAAVVSLEQAKEQLRITHDYDDGLIDNMILVAINKIGSLFNGPILGVFVLALLTRAVSGGAARIGLAAGFAANVMAWQWFPALFWLWWNVLGAVSCITVAWLATMVMSNIRHHPLEDSANKKVESSYGIRWAVALIGYFVVMIVMFIAVL